VISRSDEVTASNADIEQFVRTYFATHEGSVENTRYRNVYRLATPHLLAGYSDVKAQYERVTFQKDEARRFRPDEVEFVAFGHPLLEAIVTECQKRDEGFGGAVTARYMPDGILSADGILFNFVLRYTDASGDTLSEDLLPVFVSGQGEVRADIGKRLVAQPSPLIGAMNVTSEAVATLRQGVDSLYSLAFERAQAESQRHGEGVSQKRERDVEIQMEDLERWYQARSQVHLQRLQDYRHRLTLGEDMNVAIRREEGLLSDVQETYDSRKAALESQRLVVSQAPELLNLALVVNDL